MGYAVIGSKFPDKKIVLPLFVPHSPAEYRPLSVFVPLSGRVKASVAICSTPRQSKGLCRYLFPPRQRTVSVVICSTPRQSSVVICSTPRQSIGPVVIVPTPAEYRPLSLSVPSPTE
ncbi:hypothetical protein JTE90_028477 [Oedothorax gibbosus]|uniref:Uncharacterized protein n=1 Tax=Oedothorax gibbosus TaxID=931172 RepID=A0AAV6VVN5_9ARAC|nr:hypothetical protein JTE90_028477 [Oedothorax gibbosus]